MGGAISWKMIGQKLFKTTTSFAYLHKITNYFSSTSTISDTIESPTFYCSLQEYEYVTPSLLLYSYIQNLLLSVPLIAGIPQENLTLGWYTHSYLYFNHCNADLYHQMRIKEEYLQHARAFINKTKDQFLIQRPKVSKWSFP